MIDLLKTFSNKREVIFKCDTKCPLFKSLKDISQYSALNTTIFLIQAGVQNNYMLFAKDMCFC